MVTGRGIKAAEAFVELSLLDRTDQGLRIAQARLRNFGRSIAAIGAGLGAIGGAIAIPLQRTIGIAGDVQEELNRFEQIFGDLSNEASAFGDALGDAVGRSGTRIKGALATFQSFFVGLKISREEALKLSQAITSLGIDFASFNNLSDDEALQRFISALSGSSEVLDRFGINIRAAAIEEELLRQGIEATAAQATEQQKVFARLGIIQRTLFDQNVIGDAARTIDSYANSTRALTDATRDAAAAIGSALTPAAAEFTRRLTIAVNAIADFATVNQQLVQAVSIGATSLTVAGGAFLSLGIASLVTATAISGVRKALSQLLAPVQILTGALVGLGTTAIAAGKSLLVGLGSAVLATISAVRAGIVGVFATIASTVTSAAATVFAAITGASAGTSASILSTLVPALATASAAFLSAAGATLTWLATLEATPVAITVVIGSIGALLSALGALPIGIIVAIGAFLTLASAVDGVRQVFNNFRANVAQVLKDVADGFISLAKISLTAIRGIVIALSNGQLERAALVAVRGIQAAFFEGLASILRVATDVFGERFITLVATAANLTIQLGRVILKVFVTAGRFVNVFLGGIIDVALWIGRLIGITVDAGNALQTLERRAAETRAELGRLSGGEVADFGKFFADAAGKGKEFATSLANQFDFELGVDIPSLAGIQSNIDAALSRVSIPKLELGQDFDELLGGLSEALSGLGLENVFGDVFKQQLKALDEASPDLADLTNLTDVFGRLQGAAATAAASANSVIGGFRAAGLLQQAGGNRTEQQIADATQQTALNTAEIADTLSRQTGLVFGA